MRGELNLHLESEAGQSYVPTDWYRRDPLATMRGVVWGVIFSSPFWLLVILIVLNSMK